MDYLIDFETRSDLSLPEVGTYRYLNTPNSEIICMGWKILDGDFTHLWTPDQPTPFVVGLNDRVYAYNIQFDYAVWHVLGKSHLFPFSLDRCVDVMALCGMFTLPLSLENAGAALDLKVQKNKEGKKLIQKICVPPFNYTPEELQRFYQYCKDDVESMEALIKALPSSALPPMEQKIWALTAKINRAGLPVDAVAMQRIDAICQKKKTEINALLDDLTMGKITAVTQTNAIKDWVKSKGFNMPDTTADTVKEMIAADLSPEVTMVLKARRDYSATSIGKYKKGLAQVYNGRIHDTLRYHAAATGRWGGLGFQIHNLPRAKVDDPERIIQAFKTAAILKTKINVVQAAKALIRSIITPADPNKRIMALDFSAIENVLLLWLAGETEKLEAISKGFDHYKMFASQIYGVPYDEVTDEQRFAGKVGVLGAGYGAAGGAFKGFADGYGLRITEQNADQVINIFRQSHSRVKDSWYSLKDATVDAVNNPKSYYFSNGCKFLRSDDHTGRSWLTVLLPSGRWLYYCEPTVRKDTFGPVVVHKGLNSMTHQWSRLKLIPGRITENIVQALARDILAYAKLNLDKAGYKIIASVHDEVIMEVDADCGMDRTLEIMTRRPSWCPDLPLTADGFIEKRYRK